MSNFIKKLIDGYKMSSFVKKFINELDECIKHEYSGIDIFELPTDFRDDNFEVTPIFQTYLLDEDHDNEFTILKISSNYNNVSYLRLKFGDGRVILGRSDPTQNLKTLKFKTDEGWSKL
ncbi:MAG: hypothetical protein ACJ0G4_06550 [Alphaproteobacteria bacterium]